jgi:hypothetical protein
MLILLLALVAAVIAVITLIQSRGTALIGWAVLALALIHILPSLNL